MKEIEEILLSKVSKENKDIYLKWKSLGLLSNDETNIFIDYWLSLTYERFTNFLLEFKERPIWWDECSFDTIFIPLTRYFAYNDLSDNHELIYTKFEEWYKLFGSECETDEDIITTFSKYFREWKKDEVLANLNEKTIHTDETAGVAKPKYKSSVLLDNLKFEKCSDKEITLVTNELTEQLLLK